ncbi:unnamed protein product [Rangifer tarandus platyrhynchus]|uniref:Uncharacterized protein n=2 Tax=Rangifer tarandus platyrhynchus TaxID=3082113 RepID=A0ABN8Y3N7_RANTA|nr:unnamed protein product [Rangifer tarandus platyrhynchus]CAI9713002.1 unnamed protein product [Rangifer tarandus platyrhynchus]
MQAARGEEPGSSVTTCISATCWLKATLHPEFPVSMAGREQTGALTVSTYTDVDVGVNLYSVTFMQQPQGGHIRPAVKLGGIRIHIPFLLTPDTF